MAEHAITRLLKDPFNGDALPLVAKNALLRLQQPFQVLRLRLEDNQDG